MKSSKNYLSCFREEDVYILCDLIDVYSPGAIVDSPGGQHFDCN